jgi:hypothetical protein
MFHVFVQDLAREYTATTRVGKIGFIANLRLKVPFYYTFGQTPIVHDYYKIP